MKVIQILFVNPARTGNKNGKDWSMTEAEAVIHSADGTLQAGALLLGKGIDPALLTPGQYYTPTFDVVAGYKDRKIEAVITALNPAPTFKPVQRVPVSVPAAGSAPAQVQKAA